MPEIDLDAIVPEDITFNFRGESYVCPGDIDVETRYVLVQITNDLARSEGLLEREDGEKRRDEKEQEKATRRLKGELLKLFQVNYPDMEALPFKGEEALSAVLAQILVSIGVASQVQGNGADPTNRKKGKPKSGSRSSGSSSRSAKD